MSKKKPSESDALAPVRETWLVHLQEAQTAHMERLGEIREEARVLLRELEKQRKAEKQPHLDAGRAVDARYDAVKDTLSSVVRMASDRIDAAVAAQRAALQEVVQSKELSAGEKHEQLQQLSAVVVPGQVRLVVEYGYELTGEEIPKEWLMLDEARLIKTLKDTAGTFSAPWLRVTRTHRSRTK